LSILLFIVGIVGIILSLTASRWKKQSYYEKR